MQTRMHNSGLATEGNVVSTSFHEREAVLRCWREVVETCGIQEQLLADAAGMSKGYFSKVSSGQQGDLLGMILLVGRTYPDLRRAFIAGIAEIEGADPLTQAAEQLAKAAMRFVRLQSESGPFRMAKASGHERKRRSA